jgi:hypothetical protein
MEEVRFFYQQANRCYQLAWQSFDLRVAQRLNLLGNKHTAKARELRSQETVGYSGHRARDGRGGWRGTSTTGTSTTEGRV